MERLKDAILQTLNMEERAKSQGKWATSGAAAKSLQSCPTLCDPIDSRPPCSPVPGSLQAKNTGVGCHFLLQCMKVKSESEVAQSCPTFHDPMDHSLPGSSIHGIFQARVLEWGAIAFSLQKPENRSSQSLQKECSPANTFNSQRLNKSWTSELQNGNLISQCFF